MPDDRRGGTGSGQMRSSSNHLTAEPRPAAIPVAMPP
jgi:hypothetical protein